VQAETVPAARVMDPTSAGVRRTTVAMDTFVTIHVPRVTTSIDTERAIERALEWFRAVELCCSRFDPESELGQLMRHVGKDVPVSPMLLEALRFALALAEETGGAFDPTVGHRMESLGFDRAYRTGVVVDATRPAVNNASYRDVHVDAERRSVRIDRPVVLDLGAVAKGLAVDLAARELAPFEHFAIDAGGDLYLAGERPAGGPWAVGIRDPRADDGLLEVVHVSDQAVCTSGDYERKSLVASSHHLVDPRTGTAASGLASVTVIGCPAMLVDGLATAAFILGPDQGLALLERHGVGGVLVSPHLERWTTSRLA
jgi:thiamine biosynthesis lipoprotein